MNTDENFEKIYNKILNENMTELQTSWIEATNGLKKLKKVNIKSSLITIFIVESLFFILAIYAFSPDYNMVFTNFFRTSCIVIPFTIVVWFIFKIIPGLIRNPGSNFKQIYKKLVIDHILNTFKDFFKYGYISKNIPIEQSSYNNAGFNDNHNTYRFFSIMHGYLKNNCYFSMDKVTTSLDNDENHTIIFSKIELPKVFDDSLYLRKDIHDSNFPINKSKLDVLRIEMDYTEFEQLFDVFSTNKILATQLLTSDIMQLLIEFRNKYNIKYELTIKNNYLYIRFWLVDASLHFDFNQPYFVLDKENLYKFYKIFDFTFTLYDKLYNVINNIEYTN